MEMWTIKHYSWWASPIKGVHTIHVLYSWIYSKFCILWSKSELHIGGVRTGDLSVHSNPLYQPCHSASMVNVIYSRPYLYTQDTPPSKKLLDIALKPLNFHPICIVNYDRCQPHARYKFTAKYPIIKMQIQHFWFNNSPDFHDEIQA